MEMVYSFLKKYGDRIEITLQVLMGLALLTWLFTDMYLLIYVLERTIK